MLARIREAKKILDQHKIIFWPDCGTLLFIHRDNKLDSHDVDVSIRYKDLRKLLSSLKDFAKENYHIHGLYNYKGRITEVSFRKDGFAVDIFVRQRIGDYLVGYSKYGDHYIAWGQPYKYFEPMSSINFDGKTYKAPNNVDNYLSYYFGKDWETPKPKWDSSKDAPCINKRWL
jgi:phosphorylcholine metabolism protein LicD